MKDVPAGLECYKRTPEFTELTVPEGLLRHHTTKAGVWGRIVVSEGRLLYRMLEPVLEELLLEPGRCGVVEPGVAHEVRPQGAVRFHVEFLRQPGA